MVAWRIGRVGWYQLCVGLHRVNRGLGRQAAAGRQEQQQQDKMEFSANTHGYRYHLIHPYFLFTRVSKISVLNINTKFFKDDSLMDNIHRIQIFRDAGKPL